jgi:hypothetical protein
VVEVVKAPCVGEVITIAGCGPHAAPNANNGAIDATTNQRKLRCMLSPFGHWNGAVGGRRLEMHPQRSDERDRLIYYPRVSGVNQDRRSGPAGVWIFYRRVESEYGYRARP